MKLVGYAAHTMGKSSARRGCRSALLGCAAAAAMGFGGSGACSVSSTGLGPLPDGSAGAGGNVACPSGLTEQASWPAKTSTTSCTRSCGPDDIGLQVCSQVDLSTCQAKAGCVCLQLSPPTPTRCVACAACALPLTVSDCYLPVSGAPTTSCADGIVRGAACSPACGRKICLQADGNSACLCNGQGKYACARWNGSAWE